MAGLILDTANGVLHLAGNFVGLALGAHFGVTGQFTGGILDRTFGLFGAAFYTVLIHVFSPQDVWLVATPTSGVVQMFPIKKDLRGWGREGLIEEQDRCL